MGGAEKATGATCPTGEAQEAENIGSRFASHKRSHEEALGGLPQGSRSYGVGSTPAVRTVPVAATDNGRLAPGTGSRASGSAKRQPCSWAAGCAGPRPRRSVWVAFSRGMAGGASWKGHGRPGAGGVSRAAYGSHGARASRSGVIIASSGARPCGG